MRPPRLLAISPGDHGAGRDLGAWMEPLGRAGLPALLLREPHVDADTLGQLAEQAARWIPQVIVHDRHPAARRLPWPLHLRAGARPPRRPFGVSCHDGPALDRAFADGATYALLSPVWRPGSKPDDHRAPLGPERFVALAADRPVLALGGVDARRLGALRAQGAWGAAVLGDVFGRATPEDGARAVETLLDAAADQVSEGEMMKKRSS